MDYAAHYDRLIERARNREIIGYSERRKKSPEHRAALSRAKLGTKQNRHPEWVANHAAAMRAAASRIDRSYSQTSEYRLARSEQMKRVWAERRMATEA